MSEAVRPGARGLDVQAIRKDFPLFDAHEKLVFLDSAASSQKPRAVIDAMTEYYETTHANVHRGVYAIAEEATARYEGARDRIGRFVNAASEPEIVALGNALSDMGARIDGLGTPYIRVHGVERLGGYHTAVLPDRLEAGTFAIGAVVTGGEVVLENVRTQPFGHQ